MAEPSGEKPDEAAVSYLFFIQSLLDQLPELIESMPIKVPSDILISLATVPVLFIIVGSRVFTDLMQDWGQGSEEIFRGDRLPLLRIPLTQSVERQEY